MWNRLLRKWVIDPEHLPIEWKVDPHCAFKPIARGAFAFLGSFGIVGVVGIRMYFVGNFGGFLSAPLGIKLLIGAVFGVLLLTAIIYTVSEKHESLVSYIRYGAAYSSGAVVIIQSLLDTAK